jgi:hypothetical protein
LVLLLFILSFMLYYSSERLYLKRSIENQAQAPARYQKYRCTM